jgi:phosphatidylglycerol:prolipoprotein diacylglycerol transferase
MLTVPNIDPVALRLGPLRIHWYGIMYLLAFGTAWWLARRRAAQPGSTWTGQNIDDFIFYAMLGTILGGRVGYVLFYGLPMWRADILYPLKIWQGGMSFHGGFLGVLACIALFARNAGRRIADVFDFAAPLPGLGIFAVRIGNFINSELWGKPTTVPWGFRVEDAATGLVTVRHPSQLYEAALEGLLLAVLLWWFTSKPRARYAPSALFLLVYALSRILVEFVRLPDAQIGYLAGGWLTMGMVLSTPMLLAGLLLAWRANSRPEASGNYQAVR